VYAVLGQGCWRVKHPTEDTGRFSEEFEITTAMLDSGGISFDQSDGEPELGNVEAP
jgi:hypothetical protein